MLRRKTSGVLLDSDTPIYSMPADVFTKNVCMFLTLSEACRLRAVSRSMMTLASASVETHFEIFEATGIQMHHIDARAMVRRMRNLRALKLRHVSPDVVQDLATRAGAKLRQLECVDCIVTDLVVASVARSCLGLESLRLTSTLALQPLRVTDISLVFIAKRAACATFLREISIRNAPGVSAHGLAYLLNYCPRLRAVRAVQCGVGNKDTNFELNVQLEGAAPCERLDVLDLSSNHELSTNSVLSISWLNTLRSLRLSGAARIGDGTLQHISMICADLEDLSISNCSSVSDQGLEALASGLTGMKLKYLDVARCSRIADSGLNAVARHGNLISLDAQGCFRVTDYALKTIGSFCHSLESINLKGMGTLTDAGVELLARGCPQLRNVILASCNALGDDSLKALATFCPRLEHLDLFCVHRITDEGVMALVKGCPKIISLDLSYCFRISSEVLTKARARKYWKSLSQLHMTGLQEDAEPGFGRGFFSRAEVSPLASPKKILPSLTLEALDDLVIDSPHKKSSKKRSNSLHRQDSNSSLVGSKKSPVPGLDTLELDIAGSPRAKLLALSKSATASMKMLNLNEVSDRTGGSVQASSSPTKVVSILRSSSRRFGDANADLEREKVFSELDYV